MPTSTEWQLVHEAAERYESILVPAILGPFARALVDWSNLHPGETVVDVGCGTGAAAQQAVVGEIVEQLAEYKTSQGVQIPFRSHQAMAVK